jgi:hypothetical protein
MCIFFAYNFLKSARCQGEVDEVGILHNYKFIPTLVYA